MSEWPKRRVPAFNGAFDSQKNKGEPYDTVALGDIFEMHPGDKMKEHALAILQSSYCGHDARTHEVLREKGFFVVICLDIDDGNHDLEVIGELLDVFFGNDVATLIYSTSSATPEKKKWRCFIPLEEELQFEQWRRLTEAAHAFMEENHVICDKALARPAQPVFLPNVPKGMRSVDGKPLFYISAQTEGRGATLADGEASTWLDRLQRARDVKQATLEAAKAASKKQTNKGDGSIGAFNRANSLTDVLTNCGYERSPYNDHDWRSPHQTSKSYATRTYRDEDGAEYWISLSGSDAAANLGAATKGEGRFGDAFDLFVHYSHDGNFEAALRALPPPPGVAARYHLMTAQDLAEIPPVSWAVRGILPTQGIAAIYGQPGCGKSFMALDLLAAIARGEAWFGNKTIKRPVTYLALEGEAGISQRVKAHEARHGVLPLTVRFATQPLNLLTPQDIADLSSAINAAGGGVGVLCIDTLNRASSGTDENDSRDMGNIIDAAKQLQLAIGGVVILVHHSGKDATKGLRGHSSLHAALDAAIEVTRNSHQRSWRVTKSKDGSDDRFGTFNLEVVTLGVDEDGEKITSCVVVATEGPRPAAKPFSPGTQQAIDAYLAVAPSLGDWRHGKLVGVPFSAWRTEYYRTCTSDTDEARRKAFKRARDDLMKRGDLKVDGELNLLTIPEAAALQPSMAVSGKAIAGVFNGTCGTVPGHVPDMSEGILRDGQGHLS